MKVPRRIGSGRMVYLDAGAKLLPPAEPQRLPKPVKVVLRERKAAPRPEVQKVAPEATKGKKEQKKAKKDPPQQRSRPPVPAPSTPPLQVGILNVKPSFLSSYVSIPLQKRKTQGGMVEFYGEALFTGLAGNWKLMATVYTQGTDSVSGVLNCQRLGNPAGGQYVMMSLPLNYLGSETYQTIWGGQPTPLGVTDITFKGSSGNIILT